MHERDPLETIRGRWRGLRFGERRMTFDGVAWRLDADVFWSRRVVEALRDAPDDVAWLLAEVDRLRADQDAAPDTTRARGSGG